MCTRASRRARRAEQSTRERRGQCCNNGNSTSPPKISAPRRRNSSLSRCHPVPSPVMACSTRCSVVMMTNTIYAANAYRRHRLVHHNPVKQSNRGRRVNLGHMTSVENPLPSSKRPRTMFGLSNLTMSRQLRPVLHVAWSNAGAAERLFSAVADVGVDRHNFGGSHLLSRRSHMPISEYDGTRARSSTTSDVFNAIAEVHRREKRDRRREGGRGNRDATSRCPSLRFQNISRVLSEVGLVSSRTEGARWIKILQLLMFEPMHDWSAKYEQAWNDRLDRLDDYLQELQQQGEPQCNLHSGDRQSSRSFGNSMTADPCRVGVTAALLVVAVLGDSRPADPAGSFHACSYLANQSCIGWRRSGSRRYSRRRPSSAG